ncbi:MAG: putative porin [Bacteroidales bacterium]|nr:putative porin [Bacteroidales bacterium]
MSMLRNIWFPAAVAGLALAGSFAFEAPVHKTFTIDFEAVDTVLYEPDAYKLNRKGDFADIALSDSLLKSLGMFSGKADEDSLGLTARDTIHAPDSLREIDPFRYKYYVALLDSLTHQLVRDSLAEQIKYWWSVPDTLMARADSADRFRLDSLYARDSADRARAAFLAWYNGLSKDERRKYDYEQKMNRKMKEMDSIKTAKEERQAIRDSIRESTPRILESFAVKDSMQYKRIISWTLDPDFQKMDVHVPDSSFNHYFYDYNFRRQDVNATWLGVAGSPVQNYNYFERGSDSRVDWYTPYESWSFSHRTFPNYNTKTPYTELAYWGTLLLASDETESDNLHIFTTQNITPALNLQLLFDRWGGGGMLDNEETRNKTTALAGNYLGKNYTAHAGIISNNISHEENGGMQDNMWVRDTTVEAREISVVLNKSQSYMKKRTVFLDQQYRIPFSFLKELGKQKDTLSAELPADGLENPLGGDLASTSGLPSPEGFPADGGTRAPQVEPAPVDTIDRNVTTAFIGHSSEWNWYRRRFEETFSSSNPYVNDIYHGIYNYSNSSSKDYYRQTSLDNKLFLKLQPWSDDAIVSRLNVGVGDLYDTWLDMGDSLKTRSTYKENSLYTYAGVEGNLSKYFDWDAKGCFFFAGANLGDFDLGANARLNLFPFRKARKSPLSLWAGFQTSLTGPDHYREHVYANHYSWNAELGRESVSKLRVGVDIPWWRLSANVSYGLLANHIYYDTTAVVRQYSPAISVLSASIRKEFVIGGFLHLDNQVLLQTSSNQNVLPLPALALNLKWFAEFVAQKNKAGRNVMVMQLGLNGWYNTQWYAPAWNPATGTFHNQVRSLYENGPVVDIFLNIQWKRACIFLKLENANMGWPLKDSDYFTAHNYIGTQRELKVGIFWPFYVQPGKNRGGHASSGGKGDRTDIGESLSQGSASSPARRATVK